ncbi:MAG: hypothetical protein M1826_007100 [Phylliscum demangeonii]|nr:MAG: hypothetical protein M1826_007100 [Phylliscum demangeonii]
MADHRPPVPPPAPPVSVEPANPANPSSASSAMPQRRSSYASVVAGATPVLISSSLAPPPPSASYTSTSTSTSTSARPSALSHLMSRASPRQTLPAPTQLHRSSRHPRTGSRAFDAELHATTATTATATAPSTLDEMDAGRPADAPSNGRRFKYVPTGHNHHQHHHHHHSNSAAAAFSALAEAFVCPSYLRGSRYAERLEEAHAARRARLQREAASAAHHHDVNGHALSVSLSSSSSSANLLKLAPSQRGMTYEIVEKEVRRAGGSEPPPLPSRWNAADKFGGLELLPDGLELECVGPGKTHDRGEAAAVAAAVRTDHPMSPLCGIYYYEVTIVARGKDGTIGIGFSGPKVPLNRLPGWEPDSWAYHGDDGRSFCGSSTGKDYGPQFETGDIIGCGVNFRTGCAFFTRNGIHLGPAFRDVKGKLYPSVGMKRAGEGIKVNLGQTAFFFDIDGMVAKEKADLDQQIASMTALHLQPPMDEATLIQELVAQYLAHEGYMDAAAAFGDERRESALALTVPGGADGTEIDFTPPPDVMHRQHIRTRILEGEIDIGLALLHAFYPNVLRDNEFLSFRLRCLKFIVMIQRCYELDLAARRIMGRVRTATNGHGDGGGYDDVFAEDHDMGMGVGEGEGEGADAMLAAAADATPTAWPQDPMDTEDGGGRVVHEAGDPDPDPERTAAEEEDDEDEDEAEDEAADEEPDADDEEVDDGEAMDGHDDHENDHDPDHDPDLLSSSPSAAATEDEARRARLDHHEMQQAAIEYGQTLQSEYRHDARPEVQMALQETFSVWAYEDPQESIVAYLLEPSGRAPLAEEVNAAVLVSLGLASTSALERLCRQTEVLIADLTDDGGPGAFINVRRDYLQLPPPPAPVSDSDEFPLSSSPARPEE